MAQNALTVTPENPTPPTNISSIGITPPNPATYDPLVYSAPVANPQPGFDDTVPAYTTALWTLNEPTGAPSKIVYAANHAVVNVSTGLTSVPA